MAFIAGSEVELEARDDAAGPERPRPHLATLRGLCHSVPMDDRPATEADLHQAALGMPFVTVETSGAGRPVYQVGRKSFVFFRSPRKDAADPGTGERYDDVVVFWVAGEAEKQGLVQDPSTPFFSTTHFDGHPSVLLRLSRIAELSRAELVEVVEDAWLAQASVRRRTQWLREHASDDPAPQAP